MVNNNGLGQEIIYSNSFDQLNVGVLAMGTNGSSTVGQEGQGLLIKCNKFSQNQSILCLNDIAVIDLAEITGAIAAQQGTTGDDDSPAGNLFTLRPGMTQSDFLIETPSLDLTYFRHFDDTYDNSIPVDPEDRSNIIAVNATTQDYDANNSCPSQINIEVIIDEAQLAGEVNEAIDDLSTTTNIFYNK